MRRTHDNPSAFTMIELLVVISIVALLVALLIPALAQSRLRAREVVCGSDIRTLSHATIVYATDNFGLMPDLSLKPGTTSTYTNDLYWTYPGWRNFFESNYNITRRQWYSVSNPSWSGDELYYWIGGASGGTAATATQLILGRFYLPSTLGNSDAIFNGTAGAVPASARPLFPTRLSSSAYWPYLWTDLNRVYPSGATINWSMSGASRIGANHLDNRNYTEMPGGTHIGYMDGSVVWVSGSQMKKRVVYNSVDYYW